MELIRDRLRELHPLAKNWTLIHGGAAGLDTLAGIVATDLGMTVEVHEADWKRYKSGAGGVRNQEMVDLGARLCLAFPLGHKSSGTFDCVLRAENAGIPVLIVNGGTGF